MNAQQLKNSILQEAIEGRLVPQDPNDEPASVLLDKIRAEKKQLVKEGKLKKKDLEETPISEDEKPFEIPESWEWVRLKTIVSLITKGSSPSWQGVKYVNEGILFITSENVRDGFLDLSSPKYLEESFNALQTRSILKKGDLLTNIVGASIGRTAEFDLDIDNCNINQAVAIIRLIDFSLKPLLLKIFNSPFIVKQMLGKTVETARPNISLSSVENLIIPLPPLTEQERIVAKIEELLPKVEEYGKAQESLDKLNEGLPERLKKSILQEAIEGRLVPQDPNDEPASVLLDKIRAEKKRLVKEGKLKKKDLEETPISEDEKPFDIPESWEWHRIGFLASLYTGNSISKDVKESKYINVKGRWYIGTKDVNFDNTINYDNGVYIPEKEEQQFKIAPSGSILMCIEGGSAGRKIGIIDRDVCFGNKLCCFLSYGIFNMFIYYYLQSSNFKEIFNDNKKGIIGGVSINMMSPLLIPVPPLAEQKRIVAKIEQLMNEIDKLKI